jgi:hypothetical protein
VNYPKDINFWLFSFGFIKELPWDPGEWTSKDLPFPKAILFFGYNSKKGYKTLLARLQTISQAFKLIIELEDSSVLEQ